MRQSLVILAALAALPADYAKFRANRSMRDVEASVDLFPQTLNG